jgi:hypothetical protein
MTQIDEHDHDDPSWVVLVTTMGHRTYGPFATRELASTWARGNFPDQTTALRGLIVPQSEEIDA